GNISRYDGYSVRAVPTPGGGIGLCVDTVNKFVSRTPLPTHLTREEFKRFKGRHAVYHMGARWYEIGLQEFHDLSVSQLKFATERGQESLLEYVLRSVPRPIPEDLAALPQDASVVQYYTKSNQLRSVPAALCYPVYPTNSPETRHL